MVTPSGNPSAPASTASGSSSCDRPQPAGCLLLTAEPARAEPARLRYRLRHVGARLALVAAARVFACGPLGRWAGELAAAFAWLRALPRDGPPNLSLRRFHPARADRTHPRPGYCTSGPRTRSACAGSRRSAPRSSHLRSSRDAPFARSSPDTGVEITSPRRRVASRWFGAARCLRRPPWASERQRCEGYDTRVTTTPPVRRSTYRPKCRAACWE